MKKKLTALALVVALVAMLFAGMTIAYFTDTEEAVNVMTLGNVEIVQTEVDKDGNPFDDDSITILPGEWDGESLVEGEKYNIPDATNYVEKIIEVTNTGNTDAYVRTIILFENNANDVADKLSFVKHLGTETVSPIEWIPDYHTEINGQQYCAGVFYYATPLEPGKTYTSMKGFYFLPDTTEEDFEGIGDTYEILVLSQAVQAEGFDNYKTALDTGFGEVTEANLKEWFKDLAPAAGSGT